MKNHSKQPISSIIKPICFMLLTVFFTASCNKDDDNSLLINNQYLPNYQFDSQNTINTNLPQYNDLKFAGNYVVLPQYGINGVVLFYAGSNQYSAFELSDPNHHLQTCSKLTMEGIIAHCSCDNDENSYEIFNGIGQEGTVGPYTLRRYFVEVNGDIIRVYNN